MDKQVHQILGEIHRLWRIYFNDNINKDVLHVLDELKDYIYSIQKPFKFDDDIEKAAETCIPDGTDNSYDCTQMTDMFKQGYKHAMEQTERQLYEMKEYYESQCKSSEACAMYNMLLLLQTKTGEK